MANIWGLDATTFDLMHQEDFTNGVWNSILAHYFASPDYLLIPEFGFRDKNQDIVGWGDIVVYNIAKARVVLVYEGKKEGGKYWKSMQSGNQVWEYIKRMPWQPASIVAHGSDFCIYDGSMKPVRETISTKGEERADITDQTKQNVVDKYLAKIRDDGWH